MSWRATCADRIDFLASQPADSVDLVFGSPPYERARTYGIDFSLSGQDWVDWMVETYRASLRVCRGLVAFVVQGQTRGYRWSAVPALLMADLHRAGIALRNPPIFHRVGISGSGGPDWLRGDSEFIVCATPGGRLPWSDNTACGTPPKWRPGGAMSYRHQDGQRKNARGYSGGGRRCVRGKKNGDTHTEKSYRPPAIANPGNVLHYNVGGGRMGHNLAHENEAPFPLGLAEFFVRSFCPAGGTVCDPFLGSGTTAHAAIVHGRNFIGCDIRQSQVALAVKRLKSIEKERNQLCQKPKSVAAASA